MYQNNFFKVTLLKTGSCFNLSVRYIRVNLIVPLVYDYVILTKPLTLSRLKGVK